MKNELLKNLYHSVGWVRGLHFTSQSAFLPLVSQLANPKSSHASYSELKNHLISALPKLNEVLRKDAENIIEGFYPAEVLFSETPLQHYLRIPFLFTDAFRANRKKVNKKSKHSDLMDTDFIEEMPEYYRRDFHFQKGGYLNEDSAHLYEHQVEVLFSGTAQAMRRQIIPPMKKHFHLSDGSGLKFLELGSGTGALTRSIALAFPKAQIVCVDLSPHYLNHAQKKLSKLKRINYLQGQAENLDFKNESFDAVFSCYLFHELPEKIRLQVIQEKIRVLKEQGFLGIVDSLQRDDDPSLNWALDKFPIDFHEPFYKNYIENSLESILNTMDLEMQLTEISFLTKIMSAVKTKGVL